MCWQERELQTIKILGMMMGIGRLYGLNMCDGVSLAQDNMLGSHLGNVDMRHI